MKENCAIVSEATSARTIPAETEVPARKALTVQAFSVSAGLGTEETTVKQLPTLVDQTLVFMEDFVSAKNQGNFFEIKSSENTLINNLYTQINCLFRYSCSCPEGRYGAHCEKSTFGFEELSFMSFPSLDSNTNDISIIFATTKPNSLLLYNYGHQTGGRSDFVVLELIDGKIVFSYGGARSAITLLTIKSRNLADGQWHKVTATRNERVASLSVARCKDHGDVCEDCRFRDRNCYVDGTGPTGYDKIVFKIN